MKTVVELCLSLVKTDQIELHKSNAQLGWLTWSDIKWITQDLCAFLFSIKLKASDCW